jgi:hypothetical protein
MHMLIWNNKLVKYMHIIKNCLKVIVYAKNNYESLFRIIRVSQRRNCAYMKLLIDLIYDDQIAIYLRNESLTNKQICRTGRFYVLSEIYV